MGSKVTYFCDKCGGELDFMNHLNITINFNDNVAKGKSQIAPGTKALFEGNFVTVDFCDKCRLEFAQKLREIIPPHHGMFDD